MPKVSEEHLEQRRRQILQAAQRCFARKGFDQTTMQDIFRESGLSAGAVYRYFKSKDDLVQAIASGLYERLAASIEEPLTGDPVPGIEQIVGRVAMALQDMSGQDGPARVVVPVWAAALHDPAVAAIVREEQSAVRAGFIDALTRMRDLGRIPPDTDVHAVGAAVFALLVGFLVEHLILGDVNAKTFELGLSQLLAPEMLSPPPPPARPGRPARKSTPARVARPSR
jgi:TetR/AcrR family transcriptional regulator, transcriptional repressor of aconitase